MHLCIYNVFNDGPPINVRGEIHKYVIKYLYMRICDPMRFNVILGPVVYFSSFRNAISRIKYSSSSECESILHRKSGWYYLINCPVLQLRLFHIILFLHSYIEANGIRCLGLVMETIFRNIYLINAFKIYGKKLINHKSNEHGEKMLGMHHKI